MTMPTTPADALRELVAVIDAAGLLNLAGGVQLGPTVWYVKARDAMDIARAALAETAPAPTAGEPAKPLRDMTEADFDEALNVGQPAPTGELSDEELDEIILRVTYEGDASVPFRAEWAKETGIPLARAAIAAYRSRVCQK